MSNVLSFRKGEAICNEGDPIDKILIIQSGLVSVQVEKFGKKISLFQASKTTVLGEAALFGDKTFSFSAIALAPTQVLAVPSALVVAQYQKTHQLFQVLLSGVYEKNKKLVSEVKDARSEGDSSPLPQDLVPHTFGCLYHTIRYYGDKPKEGKIKIAWDHYKRCIQRIFNVSPLRAENAAFVLVKLKYAELLMTKDPTDPDGEEIIGHMVVPEEHLHKVEDFAEYYKTWQFKGVGKTFFKPEKKVAQIIETLLSLADSGQTDRTGAVYLDFKETIDKMKGTFGQTFDGNQLEMIEQKGVMLTRRTSDKGGQLVFYKNDYVQMLENFKFLKVIEQWNEEGHLDPFEAEKEESGGVDLLHCHNCNAETKPDQKFCTECGTNLLEVRKGAAA